MSDKGFLSDRSGNFAIIASLVTLPLVMSAGVALDFASLSRNRAALQQAMDSAAMAIAREGKSVSNAKANQIATNYLIENYDRSHSNLKVTKQGTSVSVDAVSLVPLAFGSLFGYEKWPVVASSVADVAYTSYEVALVLDTTGSMKGGKLAAMKDAVIGLVETMSDQVDDPEKLKFALVPFANFVNVGHGYGPKFDKKGKVIPGSAARWIDWEGKAPIPQSELEPGVSRFEIFRNLGQSWSGCVETRVASKKISHDTDDTPATKSDKFSLFVPALSIDEPDEPGYGNSYIVSDADPLDDTKKEKKKKLKKYGVNAILVEAVLGTLDDDEDDDDDDDDEDEGDDDDDEDNDSAQEAGVEGWEPVQTNLSAGKGPNHACVTPPILPLTNDYTSVLAKVNSLQAAGTTNIMEGVTWGMRVLSPGEPFDQGRDHRNSPIEKIMIVLTDGANVFGNNSTELGSTYASRGYLVDGRLGIDAGSANGGIL